LGRQSTELVGRPAVVQEALWAAVATLAEHTVACTGETTADAMEQVATVVSTAVVAAAAWAVAAAMVVMTEARLAVDVKVVILEGRLGVMVAVSMVGGR
jgi:threonine synthase